VFGAQTVAIPPTIVYTEHFLSLLIISFVST
jgi:hypothetical protein